MNSNRAYWFVTFKRKQMELNLINELLFKNKKGLGINLSVDEMTELVEELDPDNDGEINYRYFISFKDKNIKIIKT